MHAVVLSAEGVAHRDDYPEPQPGPGEVPVRVLCAGICETDLQLQRGYMGFQGVLGHEFVGIPLDGVFRGQRVVGEINCPCHACKLCLSGLSNHCPERTVLGILGRDGAFADVLCLPEANLHPVPDQVDTHAAVFTEPLAAAFQIPEQVALDAATRVIVLGDGRLGNLCAQVLSLHGCQVLVVGKHPAKLERLGRLGIRTQLLEAAEPARQADVVVDCTGSAAGFETAQRFLRPRGTLVLKTTVAGVQTLPLAPLVIDKITVIGSRCGPFPPALAALQRREVEVRSLIDAVHPLALGSAALREAGASGRMKVLLQP